MGRTPQTVSPPWAVDVRRAAWGIRRRVMEHTIANNGGYLSQACCAAEILATLYLKTMRLGPSIAPMIPPAFPGVPGPGNSDYVTGGLYHGEAAPDRDRFYLSPAHYALVLYAALIEAGRMAPEGLAQFNQDGSTVEMIGAEHSPGFSMMGGALAQTLSQAAGVALARRLKGERGRVWVFLSDGEFQEGQTWETIAALAFYKLDRLGVYVDVNGQQCDGETEDVMTTEPLDKRIESFGGRAVIVDGHDPAAINAPADLHPDGRPLFVLCRTDPCRGIPLLNERRPRLHYVRFTSPAEREVYRAWYQEHMAAGRGED
ncbi:MAG TPA: transketolase [Spirochaetia bacterium]|nr:transketolase [Spirochaetia bacterium]